MRIFEHHVTAHLLFELFSLVRREFFHLLFGFRHSLITLLADGLHLLFDFRERDFRIGLLLRIDHVHHLAIQSEDHDPLLIPFFHDLEHPRHVVGLRPAFTGGRPAGH